MNDSIRRLQRVLATIAGALVGGLFSALWLVGWIGGSWILAVPPVVGGVIGFVAGDRGIKALIKGTTLG